MKAFIRFLWVFLMVACVAALATNVLGVEFGHTNYWDKRGVVFLISVALFPRLTLLFSSVASGGLVWWLAWLFTPRLLVAVLATLTYWNQNPILVVVSWLVALGGESSEKYVAVKRKAPSWETPDFRRETAPKGFESAKWVESETSETGRNKR